MDVSIRAARPEDAERCGVICYEAFRHIAGQHNFPPDFPTPEVAIRMMSSLLANPHVYAIVAEADGRAVGSNFLWESAAVAGIGPITVDPSVQNDRLGRALMEDVLARARDRHFASVRLVQAAYHGRSLALYTKLGFEAREPLANLQGTPVRAEIDGYVVRAAIGADLDACNRLSLRLHGHDRAAELRGAIEQGTAMVVEHDGRISGYATDIGFFGHAIGESNEELKALIGAAPHYSGPGFLLPTRNGDLLRWCLERGLRIVQPMTLMSMGLYNKAGGAFLPSILY